MTYHRVVLVLALGSAGLIVGCNESHSIPADDSGAVDAALGPDAAPRDALPSDAPLAETGNEDAGTPVDGDVADSPAADSGPAEPCPTPGTFENVACGFCGTVDRFCTSSFVWEYGTCVSAPDAVCTPGDSGTTPCGTMCGTQVARCDTSCHWISSGACTGTGVCTPGMTERTMGGCTGGQTRGRGCTGTCTWSDYSACTSPPTDFDGDGATYDVDCDDTDASIEPGTTRGCGRFSCAGMAGPVQGTQTCSGPGWGDCVRPCPEVVPCMNGSTESRACATGGCDVGDIETRVCSAMAWGAWSGCSPLTPRPPSCDPTAGSSCGTCGEGVTYSICDGTCDPATTGCFGRGCTPGTRSRDVTGCGPGEYRDTLCDAACMAGMPSACMAFPPEVDILLVVDVTGSHTSVVMANASILASELAGSVLADADVRVGVARFADFMEGPYGGPGDEPFAGILAPTSDSSMVTTALTSLPGMGGGDGPESGMEALWVIAGGAPSPESHPFACAAGLVAGGCWRPAAQRAVILITDISQHNAPHPALSGGALVEPYMGITPAPPVWTAVRDRMVSESIALFAIIPSSTGWGVGSYEVGPQMELLVTEVGQDPSQSIAVYPVGTTDWTVASRQMAMMLARYLGLMP